MILADQDYVPTQQDRERNPMYAALDEAFALRSRDPELFRVEFRKRFEDIAACVVLRSDEVPAVGATWSEVYFHPSPSFLEFLAALRAGDSNE